MNKIGLFLSIIILSSLASYLGSNAMRSSNIIGEFVFIFTLIPPLVYLVISITRGYVNMLDPLFLYPLCYFLIFGVGKLLTSGISTNSSITADICIILGVFGYLLGLAFFKMINRSNQFIESDDKKQYFLQNSFFFEKIIFLVGFGAFALYILRIGTIPLLMGNLEQARVDASISGGAGLRVLTYFLIISSIIGFFNFYYLKIKEGIFQKSSLIVFLTGIISLLLLSNRSPVFTILVSSFLIYIFLKFKGQIRVKYFFILMILLIIALITFVGGIGSYRVINTPLFYKFPEYKPFIANQDYMGLSIYLFNHYLSIGYKNFSDVLELFPSKISFEYGASYFGPMLTVLPGTQYTLDMQIKGALGQNYLGGGTIPSALGEAYANFGYLGCFLIPFVSFLSLNIIYKHFLEQPNNPFKLIFYVFFLVYMSYNLLAGYAATSIFPFISIGVYMIYRVLLYTPVTFIRREYK